MTVKGRDWIESPGLEAYPDARVLLVKLLRCPSQVESAKVISVRVRAGEDGRS